MVKLVWRLSGVFTEKTRQIKLPDNIHINFIMNSPKYKSITLLAVSMLCPCWVHAVSMLCPCCVHAVPMFHAIYIISKYCGDEVFFQ